jgi:hypothetical protein
MLSRLELERYRPQHFRGLHDLRYAAFDPSYEAANIEYSGVRLDGIRYERKVHTAFQQIYSPEGRGALYAPAMWIRYVDNSRRKYAQPDGLLLDLRRSFITIVEIKLKHTIAAWFWLRELYEPLIRKIFGSRWKFAVCEVVKWFDSGISWPEPLRMTADPSALMANEFGVHIWKR